MTKEPIPGYCCHEPKLQFDWKIAALEDLSANVLAISGINCLTCGAEYRFDTRDDTVCPVVQRSVDQKMVMLQVKFLRPTVS